jgi:putative transposase
MSHSLTKIWIHATFGTKERAAMIAQAFEPELHAHLKEHMEDDLQCKVRIINGTEDHLHILYLMTPNYSLKDVMQNIKGESSHWVNQHDFLKTKFAWQTGYGAFSVSESAVGDVEFYIRNQKQHHRKVTFMEEYQAFMRKHGLTCDHDGDQEARLDEKEV